MTTREEILNLFGYHRPETKLAQDLHEEVRAQFIEFASEMQGLLPDGRAKALFMTNLQQASMWAHFALAEKNPLVLPEEPKSRSEIMEDYRREQDKAAHNEIVDGR